VNKIILYVLGCVLFSLGASSFILSDLGTDPLDVFAVGIKQTLGLMIGTTQSLFAILCLCIWSAINKFKLPPLSTFLTFFICGYLIDFCVWICKDVYTLNCYLKMIIGVILCTISSSFIIMSGFGIRAMDLLAITLTEKTNIPFWLYKGIAEVLLLVIGWSLGGVVGIGTLSFLFGVGWLIQPSIRLLAQLGVPNFSSVK
jgi:uncharacterized membrane protein YczE